MYTLKSALKDVDETTPQQVDHIEQKQSTKVGDSSAILTQHELEKPKMTPGKKPSDQPQNQIATPINENEQLRNRISALELKHEETAAKHEAVRMKHEADHKTLSDQVTKLQQGNKQLSDLVKSLMLKITDLEFKLALTN